MLDLSIMRRDWPNDCTAAIEYDAELEHLVKMASSEFKEWKRYSWEKAQKLEKECPELWGGISEDLLKRMKVNTEGKRPAQGTDAGPV